MGMFDSLLIPTVNDIIGNNGWTTEQKIVFFENALRATGRQGVEEILAFLHNTDFFYAPASSTYHSNYKGGLLDHSIIVFILAMKFHRVMVESKPGLVNEMPDDAVAISALLHDVCKVCFYVPALKWKKGNDGKWFNYNGYDIEDTFPIGHGEKSVIMLQNIGLDMTPAEMLAIRFHMGFWGGEGNDLKYSHTKALKICPLVLVLQMADFAASTAFEVEIEAIPVEKV